MDEYSTTERLRRHAGLDEPSAEFGPTVSRATWEPTDAQELSAAVSDFIDALDALNHELNGAEPSAAVSGKADTVSTDAAYAVAEVARMLRDVGAEEEAWAVDTGWLAVLAGDIDDVRQHIAEEAAARDS
jgi:hypothetical protein